jgi:hypothetical protein
VRALSLGPPPAVRPEGPKNQEIGAKSQARRQNLSTKSLVLNVDRFPSRCSESAESDPEALGAYVAMHIVFGWGLGGHSYPPTVTGCAAAIGQSVVGPTGLLNLLEVSPRLAGPTMPAAVRIAHYQSRLVLDEGQQF